MIRHAHQQASARRSLDIEIGQDGFVLDASALAERFGLSAETMRSLMGRQLMRGMVEKGEGVDGGTWRLSLRYGNRMWRAVLLESGELRDETFGVASTRQHAKKASDAVR
ncbi:DUF6522 family protein [Zavarzinia compransoris]|uniref:DUF6522 family protein n=1 Tax=Zavarzinia compransoris TaxID=1264899 RepID=UPI001AAD248C|nr:DUF6522 family protein [Zavarzinia compransoris]